MNEQTVKVWDPLVRFFHWTLVLTFAICFVTEDELMALHVWGGYWIGALVLFRLVWGVIGTPHARFRDFVHRPSVIIGYLKEILTSHPRRYLGHNPAGGAMAVALLISLAITVVSGVAVYGAEEGAGPLAAALTGLGHDGGEFFEELHEIFANLTLLLVVVHVAGVVLASVQHRENLVSAMVSGKKRVAP